MWWYGPIDTPLPAGTDQLCLGRTTVRGIRVQSKIGSLDGSELGCDTAYVRCERRHFLSSGLAWGARYGDDSVGGRASADFLDLICKILCRARVLDWVFVRLHLLKRKGKCFRERAIYIILIEEILRKTREERVAASDAEHLCILFSLIREKLILSKHVSAYDWKWIDRMPGHRNENSCSL